MRSWHTIRAFCYFLLLLPIVHFAVLASRSTMATLNASPETWADEMQGYIAADARSSLPQHPIVVVGGQRVKLWRGLEDELDQPVLMRPLGDAIVEDITHHYERLIGFYQPDTVVLLPSNSEFFIRDAKSAEELTAQIAALIARDASLNATRRIVLMSPLKTLLRPQDHPVIEETTRRLAKLARKNPRLTLIDGNALLCDNAGRPRSQFFRSDGINLNEHGYLRLTLQLQQVLEAPMDTKSIAAQAR